MRTLPYPALRALEAVTRLKSFSRAAEELGMTQSAVSQHVRALEDWTGRTLVVRGGRQSAATPDGLRLAEAVAEGIGRIGDVVDGMRASVHRVSKINVACPPGFAVNWLFPRLLNFDHDHPEIPVSISTRIDENPVEAGLADVFIRYGATAPARMHGEKLLGERVFPVCAPSLLKDGTGIRRPEDLADHTRLIDLHMSQRGRPPTWEFWAEQTGIALPASQRLRRFGQSNLSIQAAVQGAGVALGREPLVIDALRAGTLVMPLPLIARSNFAYWFVCPERALDIAPIRLFRDWLVREAQRQPRFTPPGAGT